MREEAEVRRGEIDALNAEKSAQKNKMQEKKMKLREVQNADMAAKQ